MADEDQDTDNTEQTAEEKAAEAKAQKAFDNAFKETGNRESDFHMVGGGDDDDAGDDDQTDDDADSNEADDTGDDDQGEDGTGDDTQAGGADGKQDKGDDKEPTIKDVIAMVQGMEKTIQTNVSRQVGGMLGRLEKSLKPADVKAATDKAADAAKDAGKKVPTKDRVDQALKSVKGFADMEKDFPDYAAVLKEGLSILAAEMDAEKPAAKPVDENALVDKAVARMREQNEQAAAAQKEAEAEFAKIEDAWPGWQSMLKAKKEGDDSFDKKKAWEAWTAKKLSGPEGKEYDRIFKSGTYRETISVFQEFSRETGVQPKKKDGTQNNGARSNSQNASNKNSERLRRAGSRPRGSASVTGNGKSSPEEVFERTFKERRGG